MESSVFRFTGEENYQGLVYFNSGPKSSEQQAAGATSAPAKTTPMVHLGTRRPHAGLEKSVKDLHRQTLALTRIKMMSGDEFERCYKAITKVFEDLHTA